MAENPNICRGRGVREEKSLGGRGVEAATAQQRSRGLRCLTRKAQRNISSPQLRLKTRKALFVMSIEGLLPFEKSNSTFGNSLESPGKAAMNEGVLNESWVQFLPIFIRLVFKVFQACMLFNVCSMKRPIFPLYPYMSCYYVATSPTYHSAISLKLLTLSLQPFLMNWKCCQSWHRNRERAE